MIDIIVTLTKLLGRMSFFLLQLVPHVHLIGRLIDRQVLCGVL